MDNTDVRRDVVLIRKSYNNLTGERTISVKPKPVQRRKVVVAAGYRSMATDKNGHTIGDVLTAKAIPFRFAMKTLLRRRGIMVGGLPFKTLLVKFYNEFVMKKPIDESSFINNVSFKLKPTDNPTGDITEARNRTAFLEVTELVNAVVERFKIAKTKYQVTAGQGMNPDQLLTDEDLTMAKAVFLVERSLMSKSKKDHYVKASELKETVYWLLGFGILIWIMSRL